MSQSRKPQGKLRQLRRRLCLEMAEVLEAEYRRGFDVDRGARLLEGLLPLTYAEADEEAQAMRTDTAVAATSGQTPSLGSQLRTALGLDCNPPVDLRQVLIAAIAAATWARGTVTCDTQAGAVTIPLLAEIHVEATEQAAMVAEARASLDRFREAVQPTAEYGITLYQRPRTGQV